MLTAMLPHKTHGTLANLRRENRRSLLLALCRILSGVGAAGKPGAVQLAIGAYSASSFAMRWFLICACLGASPVWAWEFTPNPICTLSREADGSSIVVTYDPRTSEYAIALTRASPWPRDPAFAIRFEGLRGLTISTSRHRLSEDGTVLNVTDRGFGNVLDGLQYNVTATALTGSVALSVSLDGAAPKVEEFRACTAASSV